MTDKDFVVKNGLVVNGGFFTVTGGLGTFGNSTTNVAANGTQLSIVNSTLSINIAPGTISAGNVTVNTTSLAAGNTTINAIANATTIAISNTSSNAQINCTTFSLNGVQIPVYDLVHNLYGGI
jgi:hypothetical protein